MELVHSPIATHLKETFQEQISLGSTISSILFVSVDPSLFKTLAEHITSHLQARFVTCLALPSETDKERFIVLYLFSLDQLKIFLGIKIYLPLGSTSVDSLTPLVPGANWAERELKDLSGILAQGHPDLRRLILSDDWPEELPPLRKDFPFDYKPSPITGSVSGLKSPPASTTLLPLGSFYGQKEVTTYLHLFIYGEKVVDSDYRGFYNHRGLEKMGESVLTYHQIPYLAERICACCGFSHSTSFCQALELAAHLEIPPRAQFIRTLLLEVERLYSHTLWLASLCNMESLTTLFFKCSSLQQYILDFAQMLTGNRIIYDMNVIGGVKKDIPQTIHPRLLKQIDFIQEELKTILETLKGETLFLSRLKGVSTIPLNDARKLCLVGHLARASGIAIDTRRDHPYAAYGVLPVETLSRDEGDNFARIVLRFDEMLQSLSLIKETLEKLPQGEINVKVKEIPPYTDTLSAVESPRGEIVHYVLTGEHNKPLRWKIKSASFTNLQCIPTMLRGTNIADARISIASIDPCFSCAEY